MSFTVLMSITVVVSYVFTGIWIVFFAVDGRCYNAVVLRARTTALVT